MGQFTLDLTRIVNKYKVRMDVVVQKITFDIFSDVIYMSPVKSGEFRGAWIASHGAYDKSIPDTPDKIGDATSQRMSSVVLSTKAGGVMYMVNNKPYSIKLEYGWSKVQAPAGMVRVTIVRFQDYVSRISRDIR